MLAVACIVNLVPRKLSSELLTSSETDLSKWHSSLLQMDLLRLLVSRRLRFLA